jgi:hypothetical protein
VNCVAAFHAVLTGEASCRGDSREASPSSDQGDKDRGRASIHQPYEPTETRQTFPCETCQLVPSA